MENREKGKTGRCGGQKDRRGKRRKRKGKGRKRRRRREKEVEEEEQEEEEGGKQGSEAMFSKIQN